MKKVTVIGGSGFVGASLVTKLDASGYQVKVLARRREAAKHLILLPNVQVETCNIDDGKALKQAMQGSDAVINLVGILHQTATDRFEQVHHQLPKRLAQFCVDLGIKRLVHISALQASKSAPSAYLRTKAAGEQALQDYGAQLQITVFKPSVIFGRDDKFLNMFATLIKWMPLIFLAKPEAKFQPIWVEDVVSCIVNSLYNTKSYGQTYELGGPNIYTLRELLQKVMAILNKPRPIIGLNDRFSNLQAWFLELLPIKLMSRDNVKSMSVDSVTNQNRAHELGVTVKSMDVVVPEYLTNDTPRAAYNAYRSEAGRAVNARR